MSNEPIFQQLAREYAAAGKSYERMTTPHMAPVRPLGTAKQPLMDTPVYAPNEYLDGPYKAPLPKRTVAQLIETPEPDPEFAKKLQEFIQTAPMQILAGTPAGSFISNVDIVKTGDDVILEAEVMVPPTAANYDDIAATDAMFNGLRPQMEIADEAQRFQETGELDQEAAEKIGPAAVLTKTITVAELIDGRTSVDAIQELGQEFAEKHPGSEVLEVNVGEKLNGDVVVTVRGTLIPEDEFVEVSMTETVNLEDEEYNLPKFFEGMVKRFREKYPNAQDLSTINYGEGLDGTVTISIEGKTPKQTDESVNAASNEENDEDEPVILAPNFWKMSDEE